MYIIYLHSHTLSKTTKKEIVETSLPMDCSPMSICQVWKDFHYPDQFPIAICRCALQLQIVRTLLHKWATTSVLGIGNCCCNFSIVSYYMSIIATKTPLQTANCYWLKFLTTQWKSEVITNFTNNSLKLKIVNVRLFFFPPT